MTHLSMSPERASIATDFYQLTMMYAYFSAGMTGESTFEYFVRRLPRNRRFLVCAGLEQALDYLRDLRFDGEQIDYLRSTPTFAEVGDEVMRERYFEWLRAFRFGGTVRAVPEGTIVFPNEPLLQIQGDLLEGQLVETWLLSNLNYQTIVASKAARIRMVAGDRTLIDFGTRRAHGPQAGLMAARGAYVGGVDGTSNVLAGQVLGIPIVGTAAHAYTMAFEREEDAFAHYLDTFPRSTTLLIDTYDTIRGAHRAVALGDGVGGIRLDSGDLGALSKEVRAILDEGGLTGAKIIASNDLNELKIRDLIASGAQIDVFGVGTELVTSRDDPTLSGVYKLVERIIDGRPVPTMKFSASKPSYPGKKQLYRLRDAQGHILAGALAQAHEAAPEIEGAASAEPLLETVFKDGAVLGQQPDLDTIRNRTMAGIAALPETLRGLEGRLDPHPVGLHISADTQTQIEACQARFKR